MPPRGRPMLLLRYGTSPRRSPAPADTGRRGAAARAIWRRVSAATASLGTYAPRPPLVLPRGAYAGRRVELRRPRPPVVFTTRLRGHAARTECESFSGPAARPADRARAAQARPQESAIPLSPKRRSHAHAGAPPPPTRAPHIRGARVPSPRPADDIFGQFHEFRARLDRHRRDLRPHRSATQLRGQLRMLISISHRTEVRRRPDVAVASAASSTSWRTRYRRRRHIMSGRARVAGRVSAVLACGSGQAHGHLPASRRPAGGEARVGAQLDGPGLGFWLLPPDERLAFRTFLPTRSGSRAVAGNDGARTQLALDVTRVRRRPRRRRDQRVSR